MTRQTQVVVIGGGQSGLAAGYHLRRLGIDFAVLDAGATPGGAWQHVWDSLRLFSPAAFSSLPGRLMPPRPGEPCPDAQHVVDYLADYEKRYQLPVQHGFRVRSVRRDGHLLRVDTDSGAWRAHAVVSATGTWSRPFLPAVAGRAPFRGEQLHTVDYRRRETSPDGASSSAEATRVRRSRPTSPATPNSPGSPRAHRVSSPTTSTGVSCSTSPPRAAKPSTRDAPTPAASPHWATSSQSRPSEAPGTTDCSRPHPCSPV